MNQEEINFWQEVESLIKIPPIITAEYRLYYNKFGDIVLCTANKETVDIDDHYLVVDQNQYNNYFKYRVKKGTLVLIDTDPGYSVNLTKHTQGFCVVKDHAGIILEPNESYSDTEYYAYTNC